MSAELDALLEAWTLDANGIKPLFQTLYQFLREQNHVALEYRVRPGVSHSLRARHSAQKERSLFVLVDIIDDDPEARWLSICFYADLVTDPEGRGDVVPGGLMGEDACCFDVDDAGNGMAEYMQSRLAEACAAAAGG